MFGKLFKRKHLSDTATISKDKQQCSHNLTDVHKDEKYVMKTKPVIYYSTDKGKYVCAEVPDNVNILTNDVYTDKHISTKSYPSHGKFRSRDYKQSKYRKVDNSDYEAINDIYDSYFDEEILSEGTSSYEMQKNIINPSNNLDYISKNFWLDKEEGVYYFNRGNVIYDNESLYSIL